GRGARAGTAFGQGGSTVRPPRPSDRARARLARGRGLRCAVVGLGLYEEGARALAFGKFHPGPRTRARLATRASRDDRFRAGKGRRGLYLGSSLSAPAR